MNSLEIGVLIVSWVGLVAVGLIVFLLAYVALRTLASAVISRGLFPKALAPACIIAARLRVTPRSSANWFVARTVLREIAAAEKDNPAFRKAVEELFPSRAELLND